MSPYTTIRHRGKTIELYFKDGAYVAKSWAFGGVIRGDGRTAAAAARSVKKQLDAHIEGPLGPGRSSRASRDSRGRFI